MTGSPTTERTLLLEHGLLHEPRILVVDDEPANVELVEKMLARAWDARVFGITDPRAAVETFESLGPDLVLLDLHMPHIDGWTLLAELRQRAGGDSVPIIVLTADVSTGAKRRSLELGATDLLTKPFDHSEILLRIRNVLRARALHLRVLAHAADLDRTVAERTAELNETIRDLRRLDTQRRRLLARLVEAEERDRMRLAAQIQNDQIQQMAAVGMRLTTLEARMADDPDSKELLDRLNGSVVSATNRLRRLLFELRPPSLDREGLRVAILESAQADGPEGRPDVIVDDRLEHQPPPEVRAVAYRIIHEALAAARKREGSERATVVLQTQGDGLFVRVTEILGGSGVGEEVALWEASMRERAELAGGWLRTERAQGGAATQVEFWLPT